ncbi:hypothetical protein PM082_008423 [Marasmius tenuissimus]|nr:hypothetical protein PM082_008423 [Marasmius tenuissimus]
MPQVPVMADDVYQSLSSLGLPPEITLHAFRQLYQGPLSHALSFVAQHVKGRAQTAATRRVLLHTGRDFMIDGRDTPEKIGETRVSDRSERDRATSVLVTARNHLRHSQERLKSLLDGVRDTELKIANLKKQLEAERRIRILLEALEERERKRLNTIKNLNSLLVQTQSRAAVLDGGSNQIRMPTLDDLTVSPVGGIQDRLLASRCSAVKDTLARLHSHLVFFKRLSNERPSILQGETTLEESITSKFGHLGDLETGRILEEALSAARVRSNAKLRYHPSSPGPTPETLEVKKQHILELETELNELLLLVNGLEYFSNNRIQQIVDSRDLAASRVPVNVEEGYIDLLRVSIAKSAAPISNMQASARSIPGVELLGLNITTAMRQMVLDEIESCIRRVHQTESFLSRTEIVHDQVTFNGGKTTALSDSTASGNGELLARKVAKAEVAKELEKEIRLLLRELSLITHGGRGE